MTRLIDAKDVNDHNSGPYDVNRIEQHMTALAAEMEDAATTRDNDGVGLWLMSLAVSTRITLEDVTDLLAAARAHVAALSADLEKLKKETTK